MQWYISHLNDLLIHLNSCHGIFSWKHRCKFTVFKFSDKLNNNYTIFILEEGLIHRGWSYIQGKCAPVIGPLVIVLRHPTKWSTCGSTPLSFFSPTHLDFI